MTDLAVSPASRRRALDTGALSSARARCPRPRLPSGTRYLDANTIAAIRSGADLPPPDSHFIAMVRGQWRRVERKMRGLDFDVYLSEAQVQYWKACGDYRPELAYSRGSVGFVGGRVIARLRNFTRTELNRGKVQVDFPCDRESGEPLDFEDVVTVPNDVLVILDQLRAEALDALGAGRMYVDDLFVHAMGGDRNALNALRSALEPVITQENEIIMAAKKPSTKSLKYVPPHDRAIVGNGKLINPTAVGRGLLLLCLMDSFTKETGATEVTAENLDAAIAIIDVKVDAEIASTGKAFQCQIEEPGKKGCGSASHDFPICPYCGEIFEPEQLAELEAELNLDAAAAAPVAAPEPAPAKAKKGAKEAPAAAPPAPPAPVPTPAPEPEAKAAVASGEPAVGAATVDYLKALKMPDLKIRGELTGVVIKPGTSKEAAAKAVWDSEQAAAKAAAKSAPKAPKAAPAPKVEKAPKAPKAAKAPPPAAASASDAGTKPAGPGRPRIGRPAEPIAREWAKEHDAQVVEKSGYISIWTGRDKIATVFNGSASVNLIITKEEFEKLPASIQAQCKYCDAATRKAKHLGRDSVLFRRDDETSLRVLLAAAVRSAGKPLDAAAA